jgi:hypothetical protein
MTGLFGEVVEIPQGVWPAVIISIPGMAAVVVSLLNMFQTKAMARESARAASRAARRLRAAAIKVSDVKTALVASDARTTKQIDGLIQVAQETQQTGEKIHVLVNSAMSQQLKVAAVALRQLADARGAPGDDEAATLAEHALAEHESKQKMVDEGKKLMG